MEAVYNSLRHEASALTTGETVIIEIYSFVIWTMADPVANDCEYILQSTLHDSFTNFFSYLKIISTSYDERIDKRSFVHWIYSRFVSDYWKHSFGFMIYQIQVRSTTGLPLILQILKPYYDQKLAGCHSGECVKHLLPFKSSSIFI